MSSSPSIDATLNALITQPTLDNSNLSDIIQCTNQQEMNITFNYSMKHQIKSQENMNAKLTGIQSLAKSVAADHEVTNRKLEKYRKLLSSEITRLVNHSTILFNEVKRLKSTYEMSNASSLSSSEIIIAGVSVQDSNDPRNIITYALNSVDPSKLISDILDTYRIIHKNGMQLTWSTQQPKK